MAFDLPQNQILPVDHIDVRLVETPHPFQLANAAAIDANWQIEHAANPALFDGVMVLLSGLTLTDRRLAGTCQPVRYATMLYWRKNKGDGGIQHSSAYPALVGRDNALVAIRMGKHTANAGRVYFAAGSFEPSDFTDGLVDLPRNMHREVMEETGLDISAAPVDPHYHVYSASFSTLVFRRYWLDEDADVIARRIEAFVAAEEQPEIEGPVIIRSADDNPDGITEHMRALVQWHFGGSK